MKYVLFALLAIVVLVVLVLAVCVLRAVKVKAKENTNKPAISWTKEEEDKYARVLSDMIKVSTVSKARGEDYSDFIELQKVMEKHYPNIFATLEKHDFEGNLLRLWKGSNPSKGAVLLMGHQDVVPAAEKEWTRDPFSGAIEDG